MCAISRLYIVRIFTRDSPLTHSLDSSTPNQTDFHVKIRTQMQKCNIQRFNSVKCILSEL